MKKTAYAILTIILAMVIFGTTMASCTKEERVVIREEVIDKEYIPAHMEIYTTVKYKYSFGREGFVPVAVTRSDWISDKYTITVLVTWNTGGEKTETRTVTAQEWADIQVGDRLVEQSDGDD